MPFVPFADTAEVEIRYTCDSQLVENTLYVKSPDAWDDLSLGNLADSIRDGVQTNFLPLQNNVTALREIFVRDLSTAESFEHTSPATVTTPGGSGTPAPNNVSLCVSFRTGVAGRSNRGRNYWIGTPLSALAATNLYDPDYVDSIIAAYGELKTLITDGGWTWVIASRFHNGDPRSVGTTQTVEAVTVVDFIVDSQRRRLPGRGR